MRQLLLLLVLLLISGCSEGRPIRNTMPFDPYVALTNVYLSYSAYCGTNVNATWACYWCSNVLGFTWVGNFGVSSSNGFGYVGYNTANQTISVVFRGTDNLPGWITDAKFTQVAYYFNPDVLVHEGFQNDYQAMSSEIEGLVNQAYSMCGSSCQVYVTGHSLGAALATLGALDLTMQGHNIILYNFGSPRVGNQAFEEWALSKFYVTPWRMTWYRDPVPHLPPQNFLDLYYYYHLPTEVWWNGSEFVECNGSGEDPNCSDSIIIYNPLNHADYMNINTLDGIPYGCLYTDP